MAAGAAHNANQCEAPRVQMYDGPLLLRPTCSPDLTCFSNCVVAQFGHGNIQPATSRKRTMATSAITLRRKPRPISEASGRSSTAMKKRLRSVKCVPLKRVQADGRTASFVKKSYMSFCLRSVELAVFYLYVLSFVLAVCVLCACYVGARCVQCACHVRDMCVLCACYVRAVRVSCARVMCVLF